MLPSSFENSTINKKNQIPVLNNTLFIFISIYVNKITNDEKLPQLLRVLWLGIKGADNMFDLTSSRESKMFIFISRYWYIGGMSTNSCSHRKRKGDFVKWLGRKVGSGILLLETI